MSKKRQSSIEHGRPPGENLHTRQVENWARLSGYSESLFTLVETIRRRGVKGRFFMRSAIKEVTSALNGRVRKAAKKIEKKF